MVYSTGARAPTARPGTPGCAALPCPDPMPRRSESPVTSAAPAPPRTPLTRQLLRKMAAFSVGLTLLATVLNGALEWRSERQREQNQVSAVLAAYGAALGKAAWELDEDAVRVQLAGLVNFPALLSADVQSAQMRVVWNKPGAELSQQSESSAYPLRAPDGRDPIGTLTLRMDRQALLSQVWLASRSFVALVAVELLLQALLLFALVRRGISEPLQALSRHVASQGVHNLDQPAPQPRQRERNELHQLADGITRLQHELHAQLSHREATSVELQSQRDQLNALLDRQARQLDDVLQIMADGAGVLDGQGRVLQANPAWAALMGLDDPRTLVGVEAATWLVSPDWAPLLASLSQGAKLTGVVLVLGGADGRELTVEASFSVIEREQVPATSDEPGAPRRVQMVLRDLGERLQTERTLIAAREAALSGTRAKSEFLANMSHEIRTPMNAVIGMTDLVLRSELAPVQRDYLQKSLSAARSLMILIGDILDFSKIEAGKYEIERAVFTLDDLVRQVDTVVAEPARAKGLALRWQVSDQVPARLLGDRDRVARVLINLAGNAVKFTDHGRVTVHVTRLRDEDPGEVRLRFSVRDTGVGMNPDQLARLFRPFSQVDSSVTRRHGGTGLGLAICREIVELMGGEIGVQSEPGVGSLFHFELAFGAVGGALDGVPLARSVDGVQPPTLEAMPDDAGAPAAAGPAITRRPGLVGRRVLLVEDNPLNQQLAEALLQMAGVQVETADDGAQALQRLRAGGIDLVLMDVQMPVLDGLEATRQLRREPALAALPVVAMTAHASPQDRQACLAAGMDDYLSKPIDPDEMLMAIERWIDQPGGRGPVNGHEGVTAPGPGAGATPAPGPEEPLGGRLIAAPAPPAGGLTNGPTGSFRAVPLAPPMSQSHPPHPASPLRAPGAAGAPRQRETLPEHLPGLDIGLGLRYSAGLPSLYLKGLRRFLLVRSGLPAQLDEAFGLWPEAASAVRLVHTLKGEAGTLGAQALRAAAERLEQAMALAEASTGQGGPIAPWPARPFTAERAALLSEWRLVIDGLQRAMDDGAD